jgi:hypothetical protein
MRRLFGKSKDNPWGDPYPKQPAKGWGTTILLVILFYVLSIGPATRLAQNKTIAWTTVQTIYAPLNLLAKFDPIDNALQWYIREVWQLAPAKNGKPSQNQSR